MVSTFALRQLAAVRRKAQYFSLLTFPFNQSIYFRFSYKNDTIWMSLWVRKAVYFSVVNRFVSHFDSTKCQSACVERKKERRDCCNIYFIILFNYWHVEDQNLFELFFNNLTVLRKNMFLQPTLWLDRSHPFKSTCNLGSFLPEIAIIV